MKTLTSCIVLIALLGFVSSISANLVKWSNCPLGENEVANCTIHEVDVNPCREAASENPCVVRRGRSASITFNYTPNFSGDLTAQAYWVTGTGDLPFMGMDYNACAFTACPASPGIRQSYNYTLPITRSYSPRSYKVKWKLSNAEDQSCCFIFNIKIK